MKRREFLSALGLLPLAAVFAACKPVNEGKICWDDERPEKEEPEELGVIEWDRDRIGLVLPHTDHKTYGLGFRISRELLERPDALEQVQRDIIDSARHFREKELYYLAHQLDRAVKAKLL